MPYEIQWLIPDKMLQVKISGDFMLDDLQLLIDESLAMNQRNDDDEVTELVHLIMDVEYLKSYTRDIGKVRQILKPAMERQALGWLIIYGYRESLLQFFAALAVTFFKIRFRMFKTRSETMTFLKSVDSTLPVDLV